MLAIPYQATGRRKKRIFCVFEAFLTYTRCKNAANTTLREILWHFCGNAKLWHKRQRRGSTKGAAKGAERRWPKNAAISHEVSCLRRFCGARYTWQKMGGK